MSTLFNSCLERFKMNHLEIKNEISSAYCWHTILSMPRIWDELNKILIYFKKNWVSLDKMEIVLISNDLIDWLYAIMSVLILSNHIYRLFQDIFFQTSTWSLWMSSSLCHVSSLCWWYPIVHFHPWQIKWYHDHLILISQGCEGLDGGHRALDELWQDQVILVFCPHDWRTTSSLMLDKVTLPKTVPVRNLGILLNSRSWWQSWLGGPLHRFVLCISCAWIGRPCLKTLMP